MYSSILILGAFSAILVTCTAGARILAVLPLAGKSHHIFFQAILKALALRGHQVIVYSSFPQEKSLPNYVDVHVNTSFSDSYVTYEMILEILNKSPIAGMKDLWREMEMFNNDSFRHENIKKLIDSNEKFDLVITETFFGQEVFLGFGHKFNAPTIAFQPFGSYSPINSVMGNSLALSYIPDTCLPLTNHMTFYERLSNSYSIFSTLFSFYNEHIPRSQEFMNNHFKMNDSPSLFEMIQNISLVFINAHPTIHYSQPFTPNIIPLGGIHVSIDRKPLPQKIQKFMDNAKHGVIYFSLGTIVPDGLMPQKYFQNFINIFKKLPQRVLWKTKADNISNLPENVMTGKWMPQQDILAHPNCVLFMTHGGLLSLLEAAYAGIPVVGTPFFGDQPMNVRYYEQKGVGVKLDFLTLSEESIFTAVKTVLDNPKYKENARKLSMVFRDLPISQAESAVFWVEYVLRHNGAHHLRPASTQLNWYQLALLDVLVAILSIAITILLISYILCRKILSCIHSFRKNDYSSKKTN